MNLGFKKAPRNVKLQKPKPPSYIAIARANPAINLSKSLRPKIRPENKTDNNLIVVNEFKSDILSALKLAQAVDNSPKNPSEE